MVVVALGSPAGCSRQGQGPLHGDASVQDEPELPAWARGGGDASAPDAPDAPDAGPDVEPTPVEAPTVVVGTWNLHNFSKYGADEWRLDDIAAEITSLEADLLGVQELKVVEGSDGQGPQAFDALVEALDGYEGVHNEWNPIDTAVGLLYRPETTTVEWHQPLFEGQWYPFPRPPLEAQVTVSKGGREATFRIIVLHLKAFQDGYERRKDACEKLDAYVRDLDAPPYILVGDLNDSPWDEPEVNAFETSFMEAEPTWHFVTSALPATSVTSLGWYHYVDGQKIDGEFLDHVVVTGSLASWFETMTPEIHGVPASQHADYEATYSDHFPVITTLVPPPP